MSRSNGSVTQPSEVDRASRERLVVDAAGEMEHRVAPIVGRRQLDGDFVERLRAQAPAHDADDRSIRREPVASTGLRAKPLAIEVNERCVERIPHDFRVPRAV